MSAERIAALRELIAYRLPIESTLAKLASFGWDSQTPLVTLTREDILGMLQRYSSGTLTAEQLTDWADLIECREDIALPRDPVDISEVIFRLANPELRGPITHAIACELQSNLGIP